MRKVFISNATLDKPLAELLEGLIESGIGIPHHEVFRTSLEGHSIPEGTPDFKEYIRKELDGCDTVIALIDPKVASDQRGHGIGVSLDVYTSSDLEQKREAVRQLEAAVLRKQQPQTGQAQAKSA